AGRRRDVRQPVGYIVLDLSEGTQDAGELGALFVDERTLVREVFKTAPANQRHQRHEADGDQHLYQSEAAGTHHCRCGRMPTSSASTWSRSGPAYTRTSTRRNSGFGVLFTSSTHSSFDLPCAQPELRTPTCGKAPDERNSAMRLSAAS